VKLIAVRHGETEWNLERRDMGQLDSPLTERGVRQAEALAARLGSMPIDALYTSDLGRAVQTARIIAATTGLEPVPDARLRERHLGIFQGLTKPEAGDLFPDEFAEYVRLGHYYHIPGGESGEQRTRRSVAALTDIAERHRDATVVVVTHGSFLMGFFEHVLSMEPGNGWRFRRQNAAYNDFEHTADGWSLNTWNDTQHLFGVGSIDDPTDEGARAPSPPRHPS
jgi:probable phosphoglycerate mutase